MGRIVAFGPGQPARDAYGRPLHVGDRITWAIYAASPDGPMARRGIPQKAADLFKYGHEQLRPDNTLHGGLATHTLLRRHTPILPLPDEVPLPAAAIINCAVSTVAGSLRLAGELKGRRVALWGIGMLGTIACAMCSEAGAAEIIALDVNPERLAHARRFGATATLRPDDPAAAALQADVTIDYSGYGTAMEPRLMRSPRAARPFGWAVCARRTGYALTRSSSSATCAPSEACTTTTPMISKPPWLSSPPTEKISVCRPRL